MANLDQKIKKIQVEETSKGSPISESSAQKIGGSVNWIIGQSAGQLGDIQKSILDLATFQAQRGAGWVLANGQNIVGSDLANLTGFAVVPDHRGTFQRAKDNGAGNDTERAIGNEQSDENKAHSHVMMENFVGGGGSGSGAATQVSQFFAFGSTQTAYAQGSTIEPTLGKLLNEGSSEARPINISFSIYIKTNN